MALEAVFICLGLMSVLVVSGLHLLMSSILVTPQMSLHSSSISTVVTSVYP